MGNQTSESTTPAADEALTKKISALDKIKDWPADKLRGRNEELKKQLIELQGKDLEGPEKTIRGG
jgi:hypothetical protein